MNPSPRVAFFADSFHEVNGVALTSRQFDAFARRRELPFLSVHVGPGTMLSTEDAASTLELARGAAAIPIERDMAFDPFFMRYRKYAAGVVRDFQADVIHITGPSDVGILGVTLARQLHIPLVASWHTNLHEFGARRLNKLISFMPDAPRQGVTNFTERQILNSCALFYSMAQVLLAPNQELVDLLRQRTGHPTFLMQRGADTILFHPDKRDRADEVFTIGFVGRVTPEKNVRFLVEIERALIEAGHRDYRFLIVGDGNEKQWLEQNLQRAEFAGVLKGEALARAYANMDLFAFPSHTDTFGNVVIEAFCSGVPAVVTGSGGPKFLVQPGITGVVGEDEGGFIEGVKTVIGNRDLHRRMCVAARKYALSLSWDAVFEKVYAAYDVCLSGQPELQKAC